MSSSMDSTTHTGNCAKCDSAAMSFCGKCTNQTTAARYCSRECQLADWSAHKLVCSGLAQRTNDYSVFVKHIHERLRGNAKIFAAVHFTPVITIEINETIEDFIIESRSQKGLHFAHLSIPEPVTFGDLYPGNVKVNYKFDNYNHFILQPAADVSETQKIKKLYSELEICWSVVFEL